MRSKILCNGGATLSAFKVVSMQQQLWWWHAALKSAILPCCMWCEQDKIWAYHLCRGCVSRLERPVCTEPGVLKTYQHPSKAQQLQLAAAGLKYEGEAKKMIQRFKYHDAWWVVRILADLLAEGLRGYDFRQTVLVPIPLHRRKLLQRGYNQSGILAQRLGRCLGVPVRHDLLMSTRFGRAQQGLSGIERWQNMQEVFKAQDGERRSICVIDDVVTTGATLMAADEALKECGYTSVYYAAAAVTL